MKPFLGTALLAFLFYLLLSAGSGTILFWSSDEIFAGLIVALGAGVIAHSFLCRSKSMRMMNPIRLLLLVLYIAGPFLVELTKANLDMAYRVITGNIRPGIIKVNSGMKTDLALTMLANSITLTPGTLSVDVDEQSHDLFIHVINVDEEMEKKGVVEAEELFSYMDIPGWIRRIAE